MYVYFAIVLAATAVGGKMMVPAIPRLWRMGCKPAAIFMAVMTVVLAGFTIAMLAA